MAYIKRCDRCLRPYDQNNNKRSRNAVRNANIAYLQVCTVNHNTDEAIDLCDDCVDKFYKWLEDGTNEH